jgi:sodium pump decarboxylase gamma subunit
VGEFPGTVPTTPPQSQRTRREREEAKPVLLEGLNLTIVGMAAVFTFLILLVGLMRASSLFFTAFGDRFADPDPQTPRSSAPTGPGEDIVAVLAIVEARRAGRI